MIMMNLNLYSAKTNGEYSKALYIKLKNYAYTYSKKKLWHFFFILQALFGVQFVLSVVMATMLQKFSPFISLARWILCNEQ